MASARLTALCIRCPGWQRGSHLFYFLTQIASGNLVFEYLAAGSGSYYYVPSGTENALFGAGVVMQVTIGWSSTGARVFI